jgi:3-oxoacyl-[acyl-carrier-protein] synthase-3
MAFESALQLINKDKSLKESIDVIILVGHGYDYKAPISAAILQDRLEIQNGCLTIDLPHGCSGYINGLMVAKGLLDSKIGTKILLLTGDTPSYAIKPNNSELLSIFGDSATATIIESSTKIEHEKFVFGTDGSGVQNLMVKYSGCKEPNIEINQTMIHGEMQMDGKEIFMFAMKRVPDLINQTLIKNQLSKEDIDYYVFHQANSFMLDVLRRKLKIEKEKFYNDISLTGNTVSSSIPIALKTLMIENKIKRGDKLLLAGFGLGYTWGATVLEF